MGRLTFSMSVSLDGFVDTPAHSLDWVRVDEELHEVFNDEARSMDAFVYGTRMYELMAAFWPTAEEAPDSTPAMRAFAAIWRDTPKVVCSRTLADVAWNSRLVTGDAVAEVRRLKAEGLRMDVGGPTIAVPLLQAGLVDEIHLFLHPVLLGAGTPFFPPLAERVDLRLRESRTFGSGVVLLSYETERR